MSTQDCIRQINRVQGRIDAEPYMNKWAVTCGSGWLRNSLAKLSVMDLTAAFDALYAGFPLNAVAMSSTGRRVGD